MTNETEIRPAMTPEEWEALNINRANEDLHQFGDATNAGLNRDGSLRIGVEEFGPRIDVVARDRHALAALALHGQPFGFTWDDVELLRKDVEPVGADRAVGAAEQAEVSAEYDSIHSLADRIAALLPSREPPPVT